MAFVGQFAEQKGFLLLPEILRAIHERVPEDRLRIAGTGPLLDAFRERVLRLGLGERVGLSGFLDRAGVRALYRQARAVLMPSLGEPFGLVAVESMATETPVIAAAGRAYRDHPPWPGRPAGPLGGSWESSAQDRGLFGPFISTRHQVSGSARPAGSVLGLSFRVSCADGRRSSPRHGD